MPVLQTFLSGRQLVLSWPLSAADFLLETRPALDAGDWSPLNLDKVIAGESFFLTNNVQAPGSFFRLRKP